MNLFIKLYNWILKWLRKYFAKHYFKKIRFVSGISQIPDDITGQAYIVERGGRFLWLVFDCPCGNDHRLTVNLSKERQPFWTVEMESERLNVFPSVWITDECHSHFWIKNSNIIQCRNPEQSL